VSRVCVSPQSLDLPSLRVQHHTAATESAYEAAVRRATTGNQVDPNSSDLYRRINALLDNSLDLNSLSGIAQASGQSKGAELFLVA